MWRSESHHQFAEPTSKPATLADRLQEITAHVEQLLPREKRAANERVVRQLEESGIAERILPVGAKAPEFELPDQKSKVVRSADLLAKGKLVIVFYRGRWCPYCVAQLEFLNEIYREIRAAGAELVAISPQTPKQTEFTADQHKLKFPVLSDAGNRAAREFGLDQSWELPLPATYVVAPDGTVLYGKADADYRKRAETSRWVSKVIT
jgi:peroxiredoxin